MKVVTGVDVLLISLLNGKAEGWSRDVKMLKSKYKNLNNLVMMVGGNLLVGSTNADTIVPCLVIQSDLAFSFSCKKKIIKTDPLATQI